MQIQLPDFNLLAKSDLDTLSAEYSKTCSLLAQEQGYLGQVQAQYHREFNKEFWTNTNTSIAGRNRAAEFTTLEIKCTEMETKGRIVQLESLRSFIENIIQWRITFNATTEGQQQRSSFQQHTRDATVGIPTEASGSSFPFLGQAQQDPRFQESL